MEFLLSLVFGLVTGFIIAEIYHRKAKKSSENFEINITNTIDSIRKSIKQVQDPNKQKILESIFNLTLKKFQCTSYLEQTFPDSETPLADHTGRLTVEQEISKIDREIDSLLKELEEI